jgi:probable selenium-dependent hydroxylase accessory protein YqeC
MKLYEILGIKKGNMTSIVGAGGKTTLMFLLANELKGKGKVLVTTTTKIYNPREEVNDIAIGKEGYKFLQSINDNGIYAYGKYINDEDKLIGEDVEILNGLTDSFDYILVEADGSKRKDLKAWNKNEPVISSLTSTTIGVLSLKTIDMEINNENIHRLKEFTILTNSKGGEKVNLDILIEVIFNKKGLFKEASGEKILFLNKVEYINEDTLMLFLDKIICKNKEIKLLNSIVYGSLKNKSFKYIKL